MKHVTEKREQMFGKRPKPSARRARIRFPDMTVCIAIKRENRIVTVSDMLLSNRGVSIEAAIVKSRALDAQQNWYYMFATEDMTHCNRLVRRLKKVIPPNAALDDMTTAVELAYDEYLTALRDRVVRDRCRWTAEKFYEDGLAKFGPDTFARIFREIEYVSTGVTLLVVGHDPDGRAHIFSSNELGEITDHDDVGFSAIGSGDFAALGSLYANAREIRGADNFDEVIYRACEAKFVAAETNRSVGQERTVVTVFSGDGFIAPFLAPAVLEQIWRNEGRSRIPDAAVKEISQHVEDFNTPLRGKLVHW